MVEEEGMKMRWKGLEEENLEYEKVEKWRKRRGKRRGEKVKRKKLVEEEENLEGKEKEKGIIINLQLYHSVTLFRYNAVCADDAIYRTLCDE